MTLFDSRSSCSSICTLCSESEHCSPNLLVIMSCCSHKVMNSHKYTHNQSESELKCNAHTCSLNLSVKLHAYTHKLLGGVWLLSVSFSGRHCQHARLHQHKRPGKWCSGPTLSQEQHLDRICVVCVYLCACACNCFMSD